VAAGEYAGVRGGSSEAMTEENPDLRRRFGGVARVYGERGAGRFAAAHVCVVGLGGVGSWTAEALARSGVGALTLIDLDHVAESNINRQLHALDSTLGASKIAVKEGEAVEQGQYIGNVGSSGRATGPHLHWSLKWKDWRLDPLLLAGPMD